MSEHRESHDAYGYRLTPKLEPLFPAEHRDIKHRTEDGHLHFSIAWGEGESSRNMQLWIARNALNDCLLQEYKADDAEAKLLAFVRRKIAELKPIAEPQRVDVTPEDMRV